MTYKIKPLTWTKAKKVQRYFALTAERGYFVELEKGKWVVSWMLHETIHEEPCDSIAHGKELAEQHYRSRLLEALEWVEDAK